MDFVKHIRVGQERAETGVCAEIDRPPFVNSVGKISRIGIAKNAAAEGDELCVPFMREGYFRFLHHINSTAGNGG